MNYEELISFTTNIFRQFWEISVICFDVAGSVTVDDALSAHRNINLAQNLIRSNNILS